ncbi:MAG: trigger factor [Planctomycetota bacterium]
MSEHQEILVEVTEEGPCKKRLRAELPAAAVSKEIDDNYAELAKSIQIPGFRKGRVPRSLLERRYAEKIEKEVRHDLLQTSFDKEIEKLDLRTLGEPKFDNVQFEVGQPFRFEAVFEVHPQFQLPVYKGLPVEARPVEVAAEDIERELESLRREFADIQPVEFGHQADDDVTTVDLRLLDGDQEVLTRDQVYMKIGVDRVDNMVVDGLSDGLRGATQDSELRFTVQVPDDFPRSELRGRSLQMALVVRSISRSILPAVDDDLARKCDTASLDELRSDIRSSLETRRRINEEHRQEEELMARLVSELQTELPASVVEARLQEIDLYERLRLARLGTSREDAEKEMANHEAERRKQAEDDAKQIFLIDRIAEEERIFVTEDEMSTRIQMIAATQNRNPVEVLEEFQGHNRLAALRDSLLRDKVGAFVRRKAQVVGSASPSATAPVVDAPASPTEGSAE